MTEREHADAAASGLRAFGPLKQIDAGVLTVGYAEGGPPADPPWFSCMAGRTTSIVT